jgi:hypothetical protein
MASNAIETTGVCCALADDDHLVKKPVNISCNHLICQKCIPKNNEDVICKICGELNEFDLSKAKLRCGFKSLLSMNFGQMLIKVKDYIPTKALLSLNFTAALEDLYNRYNESVKSLRSKFK